MAKARRQHRATHKPATAAASRGIRLALQALYSPETVTPEQAAAIQHQLAEAPYLKRQGELSLPEIVAAT